MSAVRIVARLRPPLTGEVCDDGVHVVSHFSPIPDKENTDPSKSANLEPGIVVSKDGLTQHYPFHSAYGPQQYLSSPTINDSASTKSLFTHDILPLIDQVLSGAVATVFAYGVTSSGKTFSMQGNGGDDQGIIGLVVEELFKRRTDQCYHMSFLELYLDNPFDLLVPPDRRRKLQILSTSSAGTTDTHTGPPPLSFGTSIHLPQLSTHAVESSDEFRSLYADASRHRSTGATLLNSHSSRSHAVLTLYVTLPNSRSVGKLHLLDLAGSENNNLTGNNRERMKESAAINTSLTALGKVVSVLNDNARAVSRAAKASVSPKLKLVPHRDSSLTRLLSDALGGTSLALIIVCLAPGIKFRTDLVRSVGFASQARRIENKVLPPPRPESKVPSVKTFDFSVPFPSSTSDVNAPAIYEPRQRFTSRHRPSTSRDARKNSKLSPKKRSRRVSQIPVPQVQGGSLRMSLTGHRSSRLPMAPGFPRSSFGGVRAPSTGIIMTEEEIEERISKAVEIEVERRMAKLREEGIQFVKKEEEEEFKREVDEEIREEIEEANQEEVEQEADIELDMEDLAMIQDQSMSDLLSNVAQGVEDEQEFAQEVKVEENDARADQGGFEERMQEELEGVKMLDRVVSRDPLLSERIETPLQVAHDDPACKGLGSEVKTQLDGNTDVDMDLSCADNQSDEEVDQLVDDDGDESIPALPRQPSPSHSAGATFVSPVPEGTSPRDLGSSSASGSLAPITRLSGSQKPTPASPSLSPMAPHESPPPSIPVSIISARENTKGKGGRGKRPQRDVRSAPVSVKQKSSPTPTTSISVSPSNTRLARSWLLQARQAQHDNNDLPRALAFYRRAYSFIPDNTQVRDRITALENAIATNAAIPSSPPRTATPGVKVLKVKRRGESTNSLAAWLSKPAYSPSPAVELMSSPNMITRSSRKRKLSPDDHVSQVLDQDADCAQVADTTGARKKKKQDVKGKGKARAVSVSASLSETGSHQVDHDEGEWEIPVSEYADLDSRVFETVSSGAGDSGSASGSGSSIGETSSGPQTQPDLVSSSSNTLIDSASNLLPSPTSRAPTALAMDHSLAPPSVIPSTTNDTDQDEVDEIAGALENIDRGSSLEPVGKETQDPSLQPTRAHSRSRSTRKARAPVIELAHIKEEQFEPSMGLFIDGDEGSEWEESPQKKAQSKSKTARKSSKSTPRPKPKSKKAKKVSKSSKSGDAVTPSEAADGSAPSTSTQDEPPSGQSTKRMRYVYGSSDEEVFARDAAPAKRKKLNAPTRRKVLK